MNKTVDSVEDAIREAEELQRSGRQYWFRGQARNWPVRSSFARIVLDARNIALEKIARYEAWVRQTPGIEDIASNADAMIAVAQHYGLPTKFIDFTILPKIAAFFASENVECDTEGNACIICLDVEDIKAFWKKLPREYLPPEFLEIVVPNLWRLEAQHGRFLFCPYDDIEHIYDFDRIYFPNTHIYSQVTKEDVYPLRKSHLEILLDQYFMTEQMIEGRLRMNTSNFNHILVESPKQGCSPDVFPNGLPDHPTWVDSVLRPYVQLRPEDFSNAKTSVTILICIKDPQNVALLATDVAKQVIHDLHRFTDIRKKLVSWNIDIVKQYELPSDFSSRLAPRLDRLWDGLRMLPFSDEDICLGVGLCVSLAVALGGDFHNPDNRHWERAVTRCLESPIEVEFGATDGSYSRGYVSSVSLSAAIRSDIIFYVSDRWKKEIAEKSPSAILQTSWLPRKTFDFRLLAPLFAREVAAYQVLARNSAAFYSPARLVSLGLP